MTRAYICINIQKNESHFTARNFVLNTYTSSISFVQCKIDECTIDHEKNCFENTSKPYNIFVTNTNIPFWNKKCILSKIALKLIFLNIYYWFLFSLKKFHFAISVFAVIKIQFFFSMKYNVKILSKYVIIHCSCICFLHTNMSINLKLIFRNKIAQ